MTTVGELLARMQAEDRELLDVAAECGVVFPDINIPGLPPLYDLDPMPTPTED